MNVLVFGMSGTLRGGIETFLLNMNAHMTPQCIFDYVIVGETCMHRQEIERRGGSVYCVAHYRLHPFAYVRDCWKVLSMHRPQGDVAYFNLFSMCHILPAILCKLAGYRVVLHAHNCNVENRNILYRLLHFVNRKLVCGLRCVRLSNSTLSASFMFGRTANVSLICNAIDVERFQFNQIKRDQLRKELGLEGKLVIGFAGRLSTAKNPVRLIDIFAEIKKLRADSVLLMVGDGDMRPQVEARIRQHRLNDSIVLMGHRSDVETLYQVMDIFLLPSIFEGLGIVLIEAQASGLPCLTSEGAVPKEAKATDLLEYISLKESNEAWAKKCVSAASHPNPDRGCWGEKIESSAYDIRAEATRLEKILEFRQGM